MVKKVYPIICIVCTVICILVVGTFFASEKTIFENIFTYGISLCLGGFVSSYFIARFVTPNAIKDDMEKTFFANLRHIIINTYPSTKKMSNNFNSIEEWEAYKKGAEDGVIGLKELLCNILHYGVEETDDMLVNDWTKEDN